MAAILPSGLFPVLALVAVAVGLAMVLRRGVPKAYGLAMLMFVVGLIDAISWLRTGRGIQTELAFSPARFVAGEQWWSPVTSVFTHAPFLGGGFFGWHLIGNLFILVTAGPPLEERVGERRFLLIFGAASLAALVAHVVLALATPLIDMRNLALGASGGIFGVLTAFAVRYPRQRLPILLFFFVAWLQASVVLLIYLGFNVAYFLGDYFSGSPGGVGWWGHFAGFFVGLAFAFTLPHAPAEVERPGSTRGLPDPDRLAPLATTPDLKRLLERVRQFTPDARTAHDSTFALAWVDKFLAKAQCEHGHAFERKGLTAVCTGGETRVEFGRAAK